MNRTAITICALVPFAVGAAAFQISPPQGLTRTDLQRHDLSIAGREVIQTRVDFAPGAVAPWHSHPGEEIIYVPGKARNA
jgi:quercetin dioxygenase-like cupin family protein